MLVLDGTHAEMTHLQVNVYHVAGSYRMSVGPAISKGRGLYVLVITAFLSTNLSASLGTKRYSPKTMEELYNGVQDAIAAKQGTAWDLIQSHCHDQGIQLAKITA